MQVSIKEFEGGTPDIKQRTTTIKCNDLSIIAQLLNIQIEYLVNWTFKENEKRVFLTDGIRITFDDKEVEAVIKTEESVAKSLKTKASKLKKIPIPLAITEIRMPPKYYFTNENIIITYNKLDLPYDYFECDKKLVPLETNLPEIKIIDKIKTVESAILSKRKGLLMREKIYHMLPYVRKTKLQFKIDRSALIIDTTCGIEYLFPMSCRDTWAILSNHFNYHDIIVSPDEKTYPSTIIMMQDTFVRFVREIELLFKPFIISK